MAKLSPSRFRAAVSALVALALTAAADGRHAARHRLLCPGARGMRRERRHLEGCRGDRALRFDAGSRQPEAWADPCARRRAAPIDEPTLRRRCLDASGRGAGGADLHRFERTELSIPIATQHPSPQGEL